MRKLYKRLVVILLFTMLGNGLCQAQELHFKRLSLKEGLSQSSVRQIIQDRQGFIWVTTEEGLNRYDGYQFLNFNHDKNDPNSLGDQFTSSIWEAPDGNLWVGTNSAGVNKMDIEHETFTRYIHIPGDKGTLPDNNVYVFIGDSLGYLWVGTVKGLVQLEIKSGKVLDKYIHIPDNSTSLSHDIIYGLLKDSQGNLWVGTHNGLNKKAPNSRSFKRYMYNSNPQDLTSHRVSKIYEDRSGRIWIGTHRGLYLYNKSTEGFTRIRHTTRENDSFNANIVLTMLEDHEGTFWVGTRDGLFRSSSMDFENGVFNFECYRYNPQNESSISDNVIYSLFEDNSNILWVGTSIGGLCKVDLDGQQFKHYKRAPDNMPGLNESSAWSFYQFNSGEIWVGTSGGGINRFDAHMNLLGYMLPSRQEKNSLSGNRIWDIEQDRDGNVWIGVFGEGLNKYVPKDGSFVHYLHNAGDTASIGSNSIIDILVDDSGIILVGTWGEGLDVLDPQTGIFTHVKEVPGFVTTIAKTSEHLYWIGTMNLGLFRYNHSTGEVTAFNTDEEVNSLASNTIWGLYSRHPDTLYAATDWGFDQIILNNGQPVFKNHNESHGLSKNTVYSIVGDDLGFLWMITTHGLSRFNPSDSSFFNFYEEDGIQSNEFNHGAAYKGKDGKLFLGGINGFNIIDPTQIKVNTKVPPVYITNMKLFNQNVPISTPGNGDSDSRFTLEKHISITEEITLAYDQAFFSFDYAALNYRQPEQNEYAYYLEGLENDWNYVQNRRAAYYTSVPYGEYVFHVKGSNNDGIWNEKGASIRIIITPPWWLSLWVKMLWLGMAIGLLLTIYKIRVNNLKRQKATLENEVATRTQEIMRQKEEMETQAENLKKMNWEIQERNNEILTQSEFIQEVNNELKDKNDALEKAYQNVALLSAIGQHITAQLSMGDMIREVYQNVQSLMQVDEFAVGRYEADSGEIVFEAFFGNNKPHGSISIKETHRLSVQCVLNKQEIFISDVEKDYPQYAGHSHAAYQDELLRALIVLPLVSGEEVTGLIWVQSTEKNAYSPHELDLLKNLAAYVSIALDNAKAYRKIKNQRQDLEKAQKVIREQNKSLSNTNILLEEKVEQRTRELNHLTYRSAHDLKGPISRLLGLCYACQLDLKESLDQVSPQFRPKLVEYLKKMEGTAISMQQMLSRLLRIHDIKMRTPAIREVSLQTVIENTWRTVIVRVNTAANINFQVDVASMGSIQTDPKLLSLLLENLYENAAQFADPAKGINYIKTEVCNQENELILKITDNGLGIDQTLTDDIFNMFVKGTTESKGVGLGLYESKIIIEKLKGSLQVDMHAQGVTVFEVRIPFVGEQ